MRKKFMVEFIGTPEAGKSTCIKRVAKELSKRHCVLVLSESAERLPTEIPKGTPHANLWMHYQTSAGLLKAKFSNADIVLIDRGLIDSAFYGKKFLWEGSYTDEEYKEFKRQFVKELEPDFVIALTVQPETAIERRGGEGRLVTEEYIRKYNGMFGKFYDEIELSKIWIDTTAISREELETQIVELLESKLA